MQHVLRDTATSNKALGANLGFLFAAKHALQHYQSQTIYSFIPKNACTSLRYSLAIANGAIGPGDSMHWIHQNNGAFVADLRALLSARHSFVILRCPLRRLASVFLDKFCELTPDAWDFHDEIGRRIAPADLSFGEFVRALSTPSTLVRNIHWAPQSAFLVYREYRHYFSVERIVHAQAQLQQLIGLEVIDTRAMARHGLDQYKLIEDDSGRFANMPVHEIFALRRQGQCPSPASLYTAELVDLARSLYRDDVALYIDRLGRGDLLFS
jgi:hypothetical protein